MEQNKDHNFWEAIDVPEAIIAGGLAQLAIDVMALFSIYVIVVISLNLEAGYTGIPNFGKMLGVAVGAFTVSALSGRLAVVLHNFANPQNPIKYDNFIRESSTIMTMINQWLTDNLFYSMLILVVSLIAATLIGGIVGLLASYPSIRLKGDYLAITLLAMAEAARIIGYNYPPIAGGTLGLQVPDPFSAAGENRYFIVTIFLIIMAGLVYLFYSRLLNSPLGRTLRAIRDNEDAAMALGKDIISYRKKVIMLGMATAALAGGLYAFYTTSVIATAYNRVTWTFWPWVMIMLGGMANNAGVVLGTFVFVTIRTLIIRYKQLLEGIIPFNVVWLDYLLLSIALVIILMVRPQGILPEKPTKTIREVYDAKKVK